MIIVRRSKDRHRSRHRKREVWSTFNGKDPGDSMANGIEGLQALKEIRLPSALRVPHLPTCDAEIITYVLEGSIATMDSLGRSSVIHAGEFQLITAGRQANYTQENASSSEEAHLFQLILRPAEAGLVASHAEKRFSKAERQGDLCVVAAQDGRRGALRLHRDVQVYAALLDRGQHVIHEIMPGRTVWLHLVQGEITMGGLVLTAGDGAAICGERSVSCTARAQADVLLVDMCRD